MVDMKSTSSRSIAIVLLAALQLILSSCGDQDPKVNTATSGRLVVLVDEMYEPLIRELADTFMSRTPARTVTVQSFQPRTAVQELINQHLSDTSASDTAISVAIIMGRELLEDEKQAIQERQLNLLDKKIGYDGLAVVVPTGSPLQETTVERLKEALATSDRTANALQPGSGTEVQRFLFTDPNSSAYSFIRSFLKTDSGTPGPARFYKTDDSVLNAVANGEGIAVMGWYAAHRDSTRVRTLKLGFTDSTNAEHQPVPVHTATLVMKQYPLKLTIAGYTFDGVNSLANGFLTWLAVGQDAQEELARRGIEPENLRFRFTTE